jgi:hypothetical protein
MVIKMAPAAIAGGRFLFKKVPPAISGGRLAALRVVKAAVPETQYLNPTVSP